MIFYFGDDIENRYILHINQIQNIYSIDMTSTNFPSRGPGSEKYLLLGIQLYDNLI